MKILIVDDERQAADRIALNFGLHDSELLVVDSLEKSMPFVKFGSFTHAFVDLRMAVGLPDDEENNSGLKICQQLRSAHPKLVIIGYSSGFRKGEGSPFRDQFLKHGANTTFSRAELTSLPRSQLLSEIAKTVRPRVFIGSSKEGLDHAREIQIQLKRCAPELWSTGRTFGFGSSTLEALEAAVLNFDFGIFVFTPDDELHSRGTIKPVARDNVIFELGLFMGRLGRKRAIVVRPSSGAVALPTDLGGIYVAEFNASEDIGVSMGQASAEIERHILDHLLS